MKRIIATFLLLTATLIHTVGPQLDAVNAQDSKPPADWLKARANAWQNHTRLSAQLPWRLQAAQPTAHQTPAFTLAGDQDNRMVFQSYRDGNYEIYAAYGDGSSPSRLTYDDAPNVTPKLRNGGVLVAHRRFFDTYSEIAQVLKDGSRYIQLTTDGTSHFEMQWSPDGQTLAYTKRTSNLYDIFVASYNFQTNSLSNEICLTCGSGRNNLSPTWSPDGTKIAFVSRSLVENKGAIWRMDASGANQRQWSVDLWYVQDLVWSPDGTRIGYDYAYNEQSWQRLGMLLLFNGHPVLVYNPNMDLVDVWMGDWSPDGAWMYFTRVEYVVQNNQLYINNSWIERVQSATGVLQRLAGNTGLDMEPNLEKRDLIAPVSQVLPLPAYVRWTAVAMTMTLPVTASDTGGAGLAMDTAHALGYTVQTRKELDVAWTDWYSNSSAPTFAVQPGATYFFRSQARDWEGNIEPLPTQPDSDTSTMYYSADISGRVTDNRGYGLTDVAITESTAKISPTQSNTSGYYATHLVQATTNTVAFNKSGYLSNTTHLSMTRQASGRFNDVSFGPYLIPTDNRVFNGSFEAGSNPPEFWTPNSIAATSLSQDAFESRTALALARLACAVSCDPDQPALIEQQVFIPPDMVNPTLALAYKLAPAGQAWLRAAISDTTSVQVVLTGTTTGTWTKAWADLTAWKGMTVNIQLILEGTASEPILVDHISLASWTTAVPLQVSPAQLPANSPSVMITITGTNFIPTPTVKLNNTITLANVTWVSDSQLQTELPANLPLGLYDLWISNPGGPESVLRQAIQVGQQHYLPMAFRAA